MNIPTNPFSLHRMLLVQGWMHSLITIYNFNIKEGGWGYFAMSSGLIFGVVAILISFIIAASIKRTIGWLAVLFHLTCFTLSLSSVANTLFS